MAGYIRPTTEQSMIALTHRVLPLPVLHTMAVRHGGERDRVVERHPHSRQQPEQEVVHGFTHQVGGAGHQVSHLIWGYMG